MNTKLLINLARYFKNPSSMTKEVITQSVSESYPNETIIALLSDEEVIRGMIAMADELMVEAVENQTKIGGWEELITASMINRGVLKLRTNPAILGFTRALLIIALASVQEGQKVEHPAAEEVLS